VLSAICGYWWLPNVHDAALEAEKAIPIYWRTCHDKTTAPPSRVGEKNQDALVSQSTSLPAKARSATP
jgi:hypothetical protein